MNNRVRAITIAVAAMDEQNLQIPGVSQMGVALPGAVSGFGKSPYEIWNSAITSGALSSYPKPVAAAIQIAKRIFEFK